MVISHVLGGLGNQMFQYAVGRAVSLRRKEKLKLDISSFDSYELRKYELDVFNINAEIATNEEIKLVTFDPQGISGGIIKKILAGGAVKKILRLMLMISPKPRIYNEKFYHYNSDIAKINYSVYLKGYWQSEKYFLDYEDIIRYDFTLKHKLSDESARYAQMITDSTSIGLHVRRGDYVNNPSTNDYHGVCSLDYYKKAVSIINDLNINPYFFIFSDDLAWVKENLDFIEKKVFIELDDNIPDCEEMYLLSQCNHNIIANSSFSWWGAWLNQNPNKVVIAPKRWFADTSIDTSDLIPKTWTRI